MRGDESELLEQICIAIKRSPYSVEEIAERARTSGGLLYLWLTGRIKSPRITTLERVADALDCKIVLEHGRAALAKMLPEPKQQNINATVAGNFSTSSPRRAAIPPLAEWLRQQ